MVSRPRRIEEKGHFTSQHGDVKSGQHADFTVKMWIGQEKPIKH